MDRVIITATASRPLPEMDLAELAAREAIRDCLYRYCRGVDRADEAALRSAYWPDATDRHGPYQGDADGFVVWAMTALRQAERSIHRITNVLIAFDDADTARVESCFDARQRQPDPAGRMRQWDLAGRYLDRFERRGGAWRIANRLVVYDWVEEMPVPHGGEAERFGVRQPIGAPFPHDPLYAFLRHERVTDPAVDRQRLAGDEAGTVGREP